MVDVVHPPDVFEPFDPATGEVDKNYDARNNKYFRKSVHWRHIATGEPTFITRMTGKSMPHDNPFVEHTFRWHPHMLDQYPDLEKHHPVSAGGSRVLDGHDEMLYNLEGDYEDAARANFSKKNESVKTFGKFIEEGFEEHERILEPRGREGDYGNWASHTYHDRQTGEPVFSAVKKHSRPAEAWGQDWDVHWHDHALQQHPWLKEGEKHKPERVYGEGKPYDVYYDGRSIASNSLDHYVEYRYRHAARNNFFRPASSIKEAEYPTYPGVSPQLVTDEPLETRYKNRHVWSRHDTGEPVFIVKPVKNINFATGYGGEVRAEWHPYQKELHPNIGRNEPHAGHPRTGEIYSSSDRIRHHNIEEHLHKRYYSAAFHGFWDDKKKNIKESAHYHILEPDDPDAPRGHVDDNMGWTGKEHVWRHKETGEPVFVAKPHRNFIWHASWHPYQKELHPKLRDQEYDPHSADIYADDDHVLPESMAARLHNRYMNAAKHNFWDKKPVKESRDLFHSMREWEPVPQGHPDEVPWEARRINDRVVDWHDPRDPSPAVFRSKNLGHSEPDGGHHGNPYWHTDWHPDRVALHPELFRRPAMINPVEYHWAMQRSVDNDRPHTMFQSNGIRNEMSGQWNHVARRGIYPELRKKDVKENAEDRENWPIWQPGPEYTEMVSTKYGHHKVNYVDLYHPGTGDPVFKAQRHDGASERGGTEHWTAVWHPQMHEFHPNLGELSPVHITTERRNFDYDAHGMDILNAHHIIHARRNFYDKNEGVQSFGKFIKEEEEEDPHAHRPDEDLAFKLKDIDSRTVDVHHPRLGTPLFRATRKSNVNDHLAFYHLKWHPYMQATHGLHDHPIDNSFRAASYNHPANDMLWDRDDMAYELPTMYHDAARKGFK